VREDANGGVHFRSNVIDQGLTVTGLASGTTYRLTGAVPSGGQQQASSAMEEVTF